MSNSYFSLKIDINQTGIFSYHLQSTIFWTLYDNFSKNAIYFLSLLSFWNYSYNRVLLAIVHLRSIYEDNWVYPLFWRMQKNGFLIKILSILLTFKVVDNRQYYYLQFSEDFALRQFYNHLRLSQSHILCLVEAQKLQ